MPNGALTIGHFLLGFLREPLRRAEASESISALKDELGRLAPPVPWPHASTKIDEKIREALDIDFGDLLVSSWVRSALLAKYLDASMYPPDKTVLAHLAEHTIKRGLRPSIDVYVNERRIKSIPLDVSLTFVVKGGILTIQGGKILEIQTGECEAKGKLSIAGVTVAEKKFEPIELPGKITFGDGKKIGSAA